MDGWINLGNFLVKTFGLPGALLGAACVALIYLYKGERDAHVRTREKVDEVNEKRVELHSTYIKAIGDMKTSVDAVNATLTKLEPLLEKKP